MYSLKKYNENAVSDKAVKLNMLLIDEDDSSRFIIKKAGSDNLRIYTARTGKEALTMAASYYPDVILMDVVLPDCDGVDIIKNIKKISDCPLLILSEKNSYSYKVRALDEGADDYVVKPFNSDELMARIRSVRRRQRGNSLSQKYEYKGLTIDFELRQAFVDGVKLHLSPVEYRIIEYLALNAGTVVSYETLIRKVWGIYMDKDNKILRVNVTNIRKKMEKDRNRPEYILTEQRVGYYMPQGV